MENYIPDQQSTNNDQPQALSINRMGEYYLKETRKWAHFLSILGFVGSGLMALFGVFGSSLFSFIPGNEAIPFGFGFFFIIYLGVAVIYFFPSLYLFKYAKELKSALESHDNQALERSLEQHKKFYKFIGILSIIGIAFYAIALFIGIFTAMFISDTSNYPTTYY